MTLPRSRKIEINFENAVHEEAERLLRLLAPDELITWGALNYRNMLNYLRVEIEKEIAAIDAKSKETA